VAQRFQRCDKAFLFCEGFSPRGHYSGFFSKLFSQVDRLITAPAPPSFARPDRVPSA